MTFPDEDEDEEVIDEPVKSGELPEDSDDEEDE